MSTQTNSEVQHEVRGRRVARRPREDEFVKTRPKSRSRSRSGSRSRRQKLTKGSVFISGTFEKSMSDMVKQLKKLGYRPTKQPAKVDYILRGEGWISDEQYTIAAKSPNLKDVLVDVESFESDLTKVVYEGHSESMPR